MKTLISIFIPFLFSLSAQASVSTINHCAPLLSEQLVSLYESKQGKISSDQIRIASAQLGNISNAFEFIVIHELSYRGTCADQTAPYEPINLGLIPNLENALTCVPNDQSEISERFKEWLSNPDCRDALTYAYSSHFKDCMGDSYSKWQEYFTKNAPSTWDAPGVNTLFIRWSLMNDPGKSSCSAALTQMFLND